MCGCPPAARSRTRSRRAPGKKSKIKKTDKTPGHPSRSSQCAPRPSWWTPLATTAEPPSLESLRTSQSPRRSPAPEKIPPLLPSGGIVLQVPGCYLVFTKSYHIIWAPCELEIWNLPQKGSSGSHCPLSRQTLLVAPTTSWPASGQLRHSLLFQSLFKLNNNWSDPQNNPQPQTAPLICFFPSSSIYLLPHF